MRAPLLCVVALAACASTAPAGRKDSVNDPIVQSGHPVLRQRAADVPPEEIRTPEFQALVARMVAAMRAAPGVGLAAPQLGVPKRVFVVEDPAALQASLTPVERSERERAPLPLRVLVNPTVTPVGDEKVTFWEGCLSVSGYSALVARFREVEVSALDEHGAPFTWRVRGWPARILQHESDHLDGTLYVDRMVSRSFGTTPQVKARFGGQPIAAALEAFAAPR
ncbi:MAG: peptide deformylase [Myxococcaceae bacterium]|nr:peptide deformylase [Myxococcaceae bacterium]